MKVLFLTDYHLRWDLAPASRLMHLARAAREDGHEVHVVGVETPDQAEVDGVNMISLPCTPYAGMTRGRFSLRSEVREQIRWCDALVVRGYWIAFWSLFLGLFYGKKQRIYDFHGFVWKEQAFEGRLWRAVSTWVLERLGLLPATTILAVSEGVKHSLGFLVRRKAVVLENGVAVDSFSGEQDAAIADQLRERFGLTRGKAAFAVVAHFGRWLDPMCIVRAAARIPDSVDVLIIGDGSGLDEAEHECDRIGAANVRFTGRIDNTVVRGLLSGVLCGCICPYSATWPNSKQSHFFAPRKNKEYLAAGVPAIVSDVPGREHFWRDNSNCLLYVPGDHVDLARKLESLAGNVEARKTMGEQCRMDARTFDWSELYRKSGLRACLQGEQQ